MSPRKLASALTTAKAYLARQFFHHVANRWKFPLLRGTVLNSLKKSIGRKVEFKESICNAGLVQVGNHWIAVAKNQKFSFCAELGLGALRISQRKESDDGVRALYRICFDSEWRVIELIKLDVFLNGKKADPPIYIEDIRLTTFGGQIVAFANGCGSWPLVGTLEADVMHLRSVIAEYQQPQKNWMPFEVDGKLYLEYSILPHVILACDIETATCKEVHRNGLSRELTIGNVQVHGGAPPLRLNEEFFLGVGNSQRTYWFQDRYYAPVFYMFEATPPFRVLKISEPLRVFSRFERIQYICGMVLSEEKNTLIISMGILDCENIFVELPLREVIASMKYVC